MVQSLLDEGGAPAFQRRAPLRLVHPGDGAGDPVVLPPFNGGLHCGPSWRFRVLRRCSRAPAFQRRAPLRPCSPATRASGGPCAPAFQRRAPLRPVLVTECDSFPGRVLPPFNGGLHCGPMRQRWRGAAAQCAPAFQRRAPLRPASRPGAGAGRPSAPAFQRRAPLRHIGGGEDLPRDPGCSRLSTAGSIAADAWLGAGKPVVRCSRLSTAGSIAALWPRGGCISPLLCSRLSTAGSIAAAGM